MCEEFQTVHLTLNMERGSSLRLIDLVTFENRPLADQRVDETVRVGLPLLNSDDSVTE